MAVRVADDRICLMHYCPASNSIPRFSSVYFLDTGSQNRIIGHASLSTKTRPKAGAGKQLGRRLAPTTKYNKQSGCNIWNFGCVHQIYFDNILVGEAVLQLVWNTFQVSTSKKSHEMNVFKFFKTESPCSIPSRECHVPIPTITAPPFDGSAL